MSWLDRFTWPREAITNLQRDVKALRLAALETQTRITELRRLIMATADDLAARIDAATNEVASDLSDIQEALAAALANADAATQEAVNAELAKLDAPIARLEALGADPADPIPAPEPPVDEPAADQPA